jgi:hypothetical protein
MINYDLFAHHAQRAIDFCRLLLAALALFPMHGSVAMRHRSQHHCLPHG